MPGLSEREGPGRGSPVTKGEAALLVLLAAGFFVFYSFNTESEYRLFPKGDAAVYTVMTVHFTDPDAIDTALPAIYAGRIFPPLVAHILARPALSELDKTAREIRSPSDTFSPGAASLNNAVMYAWRLSNLIASILQLLLIAFILARVGTERSTRFFLAVIYSMWFLSVRLYVNWAQMPDPWAFTFLLLSVYFLVTVNTPGFVSALSVGVLSKEMLLFLGPAYAWRVIAEERSPRAVVSAALACIVPAAVFFYLRAHPYFPSAVAAPNVHDAKGLTGGLTGSLSDYLSLVRYHYGVRRRLGLWYFADALIIPLGAFSALSFLVIWRWKRALAIMKENLYWLPYIVLIALVGLSVDRYVFYLFPLVLILSAGIVDEQGPRLPVIVLLLLVTAFGQDVFSFVSGDTGVSLVHQIEVAGMVRPDLAATGRLHVLLAAVVTFAGLVVIDRLKGGRPQGPSV